MNRMHGGAGRSAGARGLRAVLVMLLATVAAAMAASAWAASGPAAERFGDDVYISGGRVTLQQPVPGDAAAAGGRVTLSADVGGDALLAGGELRIGSRVAQDLYAAGGDVEVTGTVGQNARLAGGRVTIAPDAHVAGGVTVFAGELTIDGHVGGYVLVSAGRTQVNGRIDGELRVVGGELALGPQAVVTGRLVHHGATPARIAPGAQVDGGVDDSTASQAQQGSGAGLVMAGVWLLGWIVAAAVLLALAPQASRHVAQTLRARKLLSPLIGVALMLGLPTLALMLLITVVGIPLSLLTGLLLLALMLLGALATAMALGDAVVERRGPARTGARILATALALLLLFALGWLPYVGWLVWLLAVLCGAGAIALAAFGARRPAAAG